MRSNWLARRLWLVMVAELGWIGFRHWRRLEPDERARLLGLARKSNGRPSKNLSTGERREATELLDKLGHVELVGSVASIVLPFRPLSRVATRIAVGRRERSSGNGRTAQPASEAESRSPRSPAPGRLGARRDS